MALRQVFQGAGRAAGRRLATVIAGGLVVAALGQSAPAGARAVELELVLGVDTSMSVGADEFALQMAGYAAAFRHPEVLQAIRGSNGGIAVTLVQWADSYQQAVSIDWTWVGDLASAAVLADRIARVGRRFVGPGTALAAALAYCLDRFEGNGFEGVRRTVDISGDGRDNRGPRVTLVRALAMTSGITVNGLAILNDEPFLDRYYERQVIVGPDAFVVAAADYQDFAAAIVKKLVREIAGPQIARAPPAAPRGYWARAVVPEMRRSSTSSTIRRNSMSIPFSVSTRS